MHRNLCIPCSAKLLTNSGRSASLRNACYWLIACGKRITRACKAIVLPALSRHYNCTASLHIFCGTRNHVSLRNACLLLVNSLWKAEYAGFASQLCSCLYRHVNKCIYQGQKPSQIYGFSKPVLKIWKTSFCQM